MLDFPNAPTVGQVYPSPAVVGVPQWRWDGSEWVPNVVPFTAAPPVVRGHLHGLTISMTGSSSSFTVAAGIATDSTFVDTMVLAPAVLKTTGAWATGAGNGALDTGTIAAGWYHCHLIKNPTTGAVDVLISLSATSPTLPSGYTLFRRIGSLRFDGTNWRLFHQLGDDFLWDARVLDVNAVTVSTTAQTPALTVPTGLQVVALCNIRSDWTAGSGTILITSPDESDQTPGGSQTTIVGNTTSQSNPATQFSTRTDTLGRIRWRCNAASGATVNIYTIGWTDTRGRYF